MNDKEKREKLHQLLDLVLDINGFESRKQSLTGNKPTAFFQFSGHTAGAAIQIYQNGWSAETLNEYIYEHTYLDHRGVEGIERLIKTVEEFKESRQ